MKFYEDPLIPRTNNNIERYFGITLPSYIKRKYRSIEGLTRWLRLQKIRWIRRNVLQEPEIENLSTAAHLQEKKLRNCKTILDSDEKYLEKLVEY